MTQRIILLQLVVWLAWAAWLLPNHSHFGPDEAYMYNEALLVVQEGRFPVVGAPISETEPPAPMPGGAQYLFYAPAFLFGSDPRLGILWLIALTALAIWVLDRTLRQLRVPDLMRILIAVFLTWSAWHTTHSDRIWNTHALFIPSLLLLALGLKLRRQFHDAGGVLSVFQCLLFGVVAGFALQLHLGAILALGASGLMIVIPMPHASRRWSWNQFMRLVGIGTAGILITYLPYLWHELETGFSEARLLSSALPAETKWRAIGKSLLFPYVYTSHFSFRLLEPHSLIEAGVLALQVASLLLGATALVQLYRRSHISLNIPEKFWYDTIVPFRIVLIASLVLLPIYFFLNHRYYYHHYVSSVIPYFMVSAAIGSYLTIQRWPRWRKRVLTLVAAWAIAGLVIPTYYYLRVPPSFPPIPQALSETRVLLQSAKPVPIPEDPRQTIALSVLAENVFHRELVFQVDRGHVCRYRTGRSPMNPAAELVPVVPYLGAYMMCQTA